MNNLDNLKEIRKAAGLSQIQLARRANISRFRLSLAEAGSIELRADERAAIATAVRPEMQRTARIAHEFESLVAASSVREEICGLRCSNLDGPAAAPKDREAPASARCARMLVSGLLFPLGGREPGRRRPRRNDRRRHRNRRGLERYCRRVHRRIVRGPVSGWSRGLVESPRLGRTQSLGGQSRPPCGSRKSRCESPMAERSGSGLHAERVRVGCARYPSRIRTAYEQQCGFDAHHPTQPNHTTPHGKNQTR